MLVHIDTAQIVFSSEFCKISTDILVDPLTGVCNDILFSGCIPETWLDSRILVIPKPDKEVTDPSSYTPISIVNQDAKMFTAIMVTRLNSFITHYIHYDQTGFMPRCNIADTTCKTLNIINFGKIKRIESLIQSIDFEKAFNRLELSHLISLLYHMDSGCCFLSAIQSLYFFVQGIRVNNASLDDFCFI